MKRITVILSLLFFTGSVVTAQTVSSVSCATSICAGKEVTITFGTSGTFAVNNIFTAQLSTSAGAWTAPVNIGTLYDDGGATLTINGLIPVNTAAGTGYRIRVITSSPGTTGPNNPSNITISTAVYPRITIASVGTLENICNNASVSFTATVTNGGTTPAYQWYVNNTAAGTNSSTLSFSSWAGASQVFCALTSNAGCALPASVASNVIQVNPENNVSNSWLEKRSLGSGSTRVPSKRNGAFSFTMANKAFIGGGADGPSTYGDFWEFDTITNAWTQRANFGGGQRAYAVGFSISEKGYAGTGENQSGTPQSDFWRYDPVQNSWSQVAAFAGGVPVTMATGFSIGTKGYVGTGLNSSGLATSDFYEFDPGLNSWTARTSYPAIVSQAASFVLGFKGYIGLGTDGNTADKKFYSFDPSLNTWSPVKDYPGNARTGVASATVGSRAYVLGGAYIQGPSTTITNEFYAYNPANDSWIGTGGGSGLTAFPGSVRSQAIGFSLGTRAYFGFGFNIVSNEEKNIQDLFAYNPVNNTWTGLIPSAVDTNGRRGAVGFSIGTKGYITGGKSGVPSVYRRDIWEFDQTTNSWTQKANFPGTARELAVAFSIGTKGYLGTGGFADLNSVLNDFWEYDPSANTWSSRATFPGSARYGAVGFSIGTKGYIGTGRNTTIKFKDFWEYDPSANSWVQKADYGGLEVSSATGFALSNKGYVGTGANAANVYQKTFYEYNPTSNSWTRKADLVGSVRALSVGFSINGRGYIGTGDSSGITSLQDFWEYDTAANSWTSKAVVPGGTRFMGASFAIGYKGYIGTGFAAGSTVQASDLWEYSPTNTRISPDSVSNSTLCVGSTTTLHFSIGCYPFQSGNVFTAQLSDSSGSFSNPRSIGNVTATTGGSMTVTIPAGTVSGTNYRIRIIGNNPYTVSIILPNPIIIAPAISVNTQPSTTTQILCLNSTASQLSVASSGSNLSFQWYSNSANNNTGGTLIPGATLSSYTPPATDTGSRFYYCRITSACGSVTTSNTSGAHIVRPNGSWLGNSNDWHNAANWCGGVPQDSTNITLFSGTSSYPVISTASARCRNITLNSSTNITVSNQRLTINGVIATSSSTGLINALNGDIELTHSSAPATNALNIQSVFFSQRAIRNLILSKPGTIQLGITRSNDTLRITNSLSFGNSNSKFFIYSLAPTNISTLLIQSNASSTASINAMSSNNSITGNVTIERYLANQNKAWQFLSVPATGQTIKNAWQEGQATMANTRPGYGTLISSNLSNPTTRGFDMASFAPAMKIFNESTQNYEGVSRTDTLINNPKGYMLFVRGDRSVTSSLPPTPATLRITGNIYQPTTPPPVMNVPRGKFMSVGNPYASSINMANAVRTGGVRDAYYIWDPRLTTSTYSAYGLGGFRTLVRIGAGYQAVPAESTTGVSYYEASNTNVLIQSGQAFFVQSDSATGAGTLTFNESCKASGSASVLRPTRIPDLLRINLHTNANNSDILLDGAIGLFDASYNNRIDIDDIPKIFAGGMENISIKSEGQILVAERRKLPNPSDTVHLELKNLRQRSYSLAFMGEMFSPYSITPILIDRYLGTSTELNKTGPSIYPFEVTSNPASSTTDRFYIIFKPENYPMEISYRSKR